MDHRSFASANHSLKKRTRCERFLADMWRLVPWLQQIASIKPLAPHLQSSFAVAAFRGAGRQHAELMPTWRVAIATGMRSWITSARIAGWRDVQALWVGGDMVIMRTCDGETFSLGSGSQVLWPREPPPR
jgi:hypothetical protein